MIDKSLRNTLISVFVPFFLTVIIILATEWISIDRRMGLLEQQQQADHQLILQHNSDMDEIRTSIVNIEQGIIKLQDLKQDKHFDNDEQN